MKVYIFCIGIISMRDKIEVSLHINGEPIKQELVEKREDIKQIALKMMEETSFTDE